MVISQYNIYGLLVCVTIVVLFHFVLILFYLHAGRYSSSYGIYTWFTCSFHAYLISPYLDMSYAMPRYTEWMTTVTETNANFYFLAGEQIWILFVAQLCEWRKKNYFLILCTVYKKIKQFVWGSCLIFHLNSYWRFLKILRRAVKP